ncbi:MAG: TauD/TfdA family dioxygenase [Gammaproteobacteria bacterium]|nr:TauD/TfdA family dioxygenase [Gammaproteobacteria bacterium]
MQVLPITAALGAEIRGLDLSQPLTEDDVNGVRRALLEHGVIFFRQQNISEQDQVRFTNYFGRAVEHVREQPDRPVKEIFVISNIEEHNKPTGALGNDEINFHSDLSYLRQPGTISILYSVELPKTGGATQWCNCSAAYEALDEATKESLRGLRAVHRHPVDSQNEALPVDQPVVRTHPETGRKSLYISPHFTQYIVDLEQSESRQLLDELFAHILQPRFVWTHEWRHGDLVMWDNRFTMHRREPFPANERRLLKRTQIYNEEITYE